jgi:hypothetical protein
VVRLLLNHSVIFFMLVTLALGVLGSVGLLGSRYGPQLVPAGAIGFACGISVGVFLAAAFFLLRHVSQSSRWAKLVGLIGGVLILGLFLLVSR